LLSFAASDVVDLGISEQDSHAVRRTRQPQGMLAMHRFGRDVQVTVTKTIEFDLEHHLGGGRNRALPSRMVDEESDRSSPVLTMEEQQIRTMELQMKQDLEL
jgi:hypothetical protein